MLEYYNLALHRINEAFDNNSIFLDLSFLRLNHIPKEILKLSNLIYLDLSYNFIQELPLELSNFSKLKFLNLSHNLFNFHNLKNHEWIVEIEDLILEMNPILQDIPLEIRESGLDAIFNYFESAKVTTTSKLYETKLLIVGNGEVGKTTLMKKLLNPKLKIEVGQEPSTHGIDINRWNLSCSFPLKEPYISFGEYEDDYYEDEDEDEYYNYEEDDEQEEEEDIEKRERENYTNFNDDEDFLDEDKYNKNYQGNSYRNSLYYLNRNIHYDNFFDEIDDEDNYESLFTIDTKSYNVFRKNVKLNIWDFGGQEIYHATHQFFLTKRSIYLFLWEARKEEEYHTFEYWLNIIKFLSLDSPVIMIMNKSDIRIKNIDEYSLKKGFPNISNFLRISCSTGEGINELISEIKKSLRRLPHLTDDLPNSWIGIRDELQNLNKNYISLDYYYDLCFKWKLTISGADFLSDYFHDLGVILHFKNDSILQNIIILNPEWATTALYNLIDNQHIQKNNGRFAFDYLKQAWNIDEYPIMKHHELMRLMEKFELCFNLIGTDNYIIPELLPSNRPSLFQFNDKENLKFEYIYKFMPAGLLSRLICRLHHLIDKEYFWKDGVVFKFDDSLALIINERINKKFKITIIGENRTNLLAIIRENLVFIHNSINLKKIDDFNEMIPCICKVCLNSAAPHYYDFATLKMYEKKGRNTIDCYKGAEQVPVKNLLNGFEYKNAKNPILQLIIMACSKLQQNHKILSSKEDSRNSFIASLVDTHYIAKDQTRAGISESGKSIGELDFLIVNNEKIPQSVFEAFNLGFLDKTVINKHLNKIFGYDTNGLKENFIVVYCDSNNFYSLHTNYFNYIENFKFEYTSIKTEDVSDEYSYGSELKVFLSKHTRNNEITKIFHILVNLHYNNRE